MQERRPPPENVTILLTHRTAVIEVNHDRLAGHMGLFTHLPAGSEIKIIGPGFNENTCQILYLDKRYYAFPVDLS